jgi:hypothetical protein
MATRKAVGITGIGCQLIHKKGGMGKKKKRSKKRKTH